MMNSPKISELGASCCGCGACAARCPKECISMELDACGFLHPKIDQLLCIGCGVCDNICPAMQKNGQDELRSALWAKAREESALERSSSGGIFSLLARSTFDGGGIVVGAAWTEGCRAVEHIVIDSVDNLDKVMRSKYIQSRIDEKVYQAVRVALQRGRSVLFAGTSCQIAGMRGYLGKLADSKCLLLVDVICHGAPSPGLWSEWILYRERKSGGPVSEVNMRNKSAGWQDFSIRYDYLSHPDNVGTSDSWSFKQDWFMRAFLSNASIRESCFSCPVKRRCGSDITLGDFWGFQKLHPDIDCAMGMSAVLCNTKKGEDAVSCIKNDVVCGKATFEEIVAGNSCLVGSAKPYILRDDFMKELAGQNSIDQLVEHWPFQPSLKGRIKKVVVSIKQKITGR